MKPGICLVLLMFLHVDYGQTCDTDNDCDFPLLECSSGSCRQKQCINESECGLVNSECYNNYCDCKDGYLKEGIFCKPVFDIGCSTNDDCLYTGLECRLTEFGSLCRCPVGYAVRSSNDLTCSKVLDSRCTDVQLCGDTEHVNYWHSYHDSYMLENSWGRRPHLGYQCNLQGRCSCGPGFIRSVDGLKCRQIYDAPCTNDSDCQGDHDVHTESYLCQSGICACNDMYNAESYWYPTWVDIIRYRNLKDEHVYIFFVEIGSWQCDDSVDETTCLQVQHNYFTHCKFGIEENGNCNKVLGHACELNRETCNLVHNAKCNSSYQCSCRNGFRENDTSDSCSPGDLAVLDSGEELQTQALVADLVTGNILEEIDVKLRRCSNNYHLLIPTLSVAFSAFCLGLDTNFSVESGDRWAEVVPELFYTREYDSETQEEMSIPHLYFKCYAFDHYYNSYQNDRNCNGCDRYYYGENDALYYSWAINTGSEGTHIMTNTYYTPLGCRTPSSTTDTTCLVEWKLEDSSDCPFPAQDDEHTLCGVAVYGLTEFGLNQYGSWQYAVRQHILAKWDWTGVSSNVEISGLKLVLDESGQDQKSNVHKIQFQSTQTDHNIWNGYAIPDVLVQIKSESNEQNGETRLCAVT
ncbi:hypothetical protein MAR_008320, partial [Mya arenaria]